MYVPRTKTFTFVSIGLALSLSLAGCAQPVEPVTQPTSTPTASEIPAYPTTMIHSGGETTLEQKPERVVTLGSEQTDAALALGILPVGSEPAFEGPWRLDAIQELGGSTPVEIEPAELDPGDGDTIADVQELNPDLIVAGQARYFYDSDSAPIDAFYNSLPDAAPTIRLPEASISTVAPPQGYEYPYSTGTAWRDALVQAGQAYGESERATELLASIDSSLAEAAAAHPEFEGKTVAVLVSEPGAKGVLNQTAAFPLVLEQLGFVPIDTTTIASEGQNDLRPEVTILRDQLALLDVDVVLVAGSYNPELSWNEPLEQSPAGQNAVIHYLDPQSEGRPTSWALTSPTVLSLPWALDAFVTALSEEMK